MTNRHCYMLVKLRFHLNPTHSSIEASRWLACMMFAPRLVIHVICVCVFGQYTTGILFGAPATDYFADDWEPVFRIYAGSQWDSHADFLGPIRIAETSNTQSAQFRSWNLDRWHEIQPKKVKVEVYDDGYRVAVFEFDSAGQNLTSVFRQRNLKSTSFEDLSLAGSKFTGDDFSLDGDSDARHWVVSSRHVGDCRSDEGWFQVLDKPKAGRDRCVCGYENVDKYPTIMYAKGNRKTRWSDRGKVGHADMMLVSISRRPYVIPTPPPPAQPQPQLHDFLANTQPLFPQQQHHQSFSSNTMFNFELRK